MATKISRINKIIPLLLVALLLRSILSFFGTLRLDFNTFVAWSNMLFEGGFKVFYNSWSDYLPGYLYILWFLRFVKEYASFVPDALLYKLPAIIADVFTGLIVYKVVNKKFGEKKALLSTSFFLFNPAIIANSTLWGQADSLVSLFSILSVYCFSSSWFLSSVFLAVATIIKPQAGLTAIVILYLYLKNKNIFDLVKYVFLSGLTFFALFLPFWNNNNFFGFVLSRLNQTLSQYQYTSVNAFNLWGFVGMWKADKIESIVGLVMFGIFVIISTHFLFKKKSVYKEYLLLFVLFLGNFIFFTRMHERHLFPVFAPLSILISESLMLIIPFVIFSIIYLLNLRYAFVWITQDFKNIFGDMGVKLISLFNTLTALLIPIFQRGLKIKIPKFERNRRLWKTEEISKNTLRLILLLIIIFAFISRFLYLGNIKKEYFDEVYHSFTARLVLHGDPKAWEWWNPHPEGFAFEWTHPPIAKLGMALGMIIFGENSFGWRAPQALLGTFSVLFIYIIAWEIFKDKLVAIFSCFIYALDGLPLVLSRIGMNDMYFLPFALFSLYLFLKDKRFLSSILFGLAIASKWSAVYMIPIFLGCFFVLNKKWKINLLWYVVIPPLIYLFSYFFMFQTGHDIKTFIDVQKQMWWYHTNLKATHPYQSSWWTWPLLLRPIWLYTSSTDTQIANIYGMGNPAVFWGGLFSVFYLLFLGIKQKSKKILLVVFSYFVLFAPWAFSPRIMFFYHYLPSIPFLAVAFGITLRQLWDKNRTVVFLLFTICLTFYVYFYPHWTGISVPKWLDNSYYWISSWK